MGDGPERDRTSDREQEPAHKPKDQEPSPEDRIAQPRNVLTGIVLPVILLVTVLVVVMSMNSSPLFAACDHYTIIQLIYPLIFGALGATIGGNIRLTGPVAVLGGNWNGVVAGGIAAALLGFAITAWIKPASCTPRQELRLQRFVVRNQFNATAQDKVVTRDYIGRIDWSDTKVDVVVARSVDYSRDLRLLFTGDDEFQIRLDFYRNVDGASYYQPAGLCTLEIKVGRPQSRPDEIQFQLVPNNEHNEVQLNPKLFDQLEDQLKTNPSKPAVDCIIAEGREGGDRNKTVELRPVKELYVVTPALSPASLFKPVEFWFIVPAPKEQDAKTSARGAEATQGEVTPPTKPAEPPPVDRTPPPVKQVVTGCASPSDARRSDIDAYLQGDDLDQPRRMALHADWTNLHCYVWSFVAKNDVATNSTQRSRALHLTAGAILNTPATPDQIAGYWQPLGENKRDFSKSLPYLTVPDHKIVFDLVKSDDALLRGEAMRTIRYLPVDRFESLFRQQLATLGSLKAAEQERLAIAASFMYYNRLVEWLDEEQAPPPSPAQIAAEYSGAKQWISTNLLGKSTNGYDAMLLYAKGIVERERQLTPDLGKSTFVAMTKSVEGMEDSYPSNVRHIAQALAFGRGGSDTLTILGLIKEVDVYPAATPMAFDNPLPSQQNLFAGPGEQFQRQTVPLNGVNAAKARLLLRKGDWYLANAPGWVGWIHRPGKPS